MSEAQKIANVNGSELAQTAKLAKGLRVVCRHTFTLREAFSDSGKESASRLGIPGRAVEELLIQAARVCAQVDDLDVQSLGRGPSFLKRLRSRISHE